MKSTVLKPSSHPLAAYIDLLESGKALLPESTENVVEVVGVVESEIESIVQTLEESNVGVGRADDLPGAVRIGAGDLLPDRVRAEGRVGIVTISESAGVRRIVYRDAWQHAYRIDQGKSVEVGAIRLRERDVFAERETPASCFRVHTEAEALESGVAYRALLYHVSATDEIIRGRGSARQRQVMILNGP